MISLLNLQNKFNLTTTYNMPKSTIPMFKEIEAPIAIFSNIIHDITENLCKIVNPYAIKVNQNQLYELNSTSINSNNSIYNKLAINSEIVFVDDTLLIYGWIKIVMINNKMCFKFLKTNIEYNDIKIINAIYENYEVFAQNFYRYIQMFNKIAFGIDDVPMNLVNNIKLDLQKNAQKKTYESSIYLLPFKNKLSKNDVDNDWNDFYNKYDYAIKFYHNDSKNFKYVIFKFLKSDLNENNSLENIRYLETDILKKDTVLISDAGEFTKQLFIYGNIIKSVTLKTTK